MIGLFVGWRVRRSSPRTQGRGWLAYAVSAGMVVYVSLVAMSAYADDIAYGYDALGRLTSVSVGGATAYYDYDAAGNITAIRRQTSVSLAPSVGSTAHAARSRDIAAM
ncbi:MAG: FIG00457951: hypothetical protein [uncultured Paraburkholderia sp.]|nr:MAG: FIG00457951: hypothetical protein [uncultured Paraburkholderia sp.]